MVSTAIQGADDGVAEPLAEVGQLRERRVAGLRGHQPPQRLEQVLQMHRACAPVRTRMCSYSQSCCDATRLEAI